MCPPPRVPGALWGLTTIAPAAFVVSHSTFVWPICWLLCLVSGPCSGSLIGWEPGVLWVAGAWPHTPEDWDLSLPSPLTQKSYKHLGHVPILLPSSWPCQKCQSAEDGICLASLVAGLDSWSAFKPCSKRHHHHSDHWLSV